MKVFSLALMMVVLMVTSIAQADYTINRFPVCEATGDQTVPDIDGDWIIWQDGRDDDGDIYGYTLAESLEIEICTDSGTAQRTPVVSGNKVVWRDERNSQRDIYAFDLFLRTPLTEPNMPFEDGVYQQDPDISGNLTVYRHDGTHKNIYVYDSDLNTNQSVSAASTHQYEPAIDGTLVAWIEIAGIPQVYYRDVDISTAVQTLGSGTFTQRYPAISDGVIVWEEDRGATGKDIYGYDPGAGIFPICTAASDQEIPAISGSIVAWQDDGDGNGVYDIWAIDLADMAAGCFEVSDGTGDNRYPAVSGNTIVWQRSGDIWAAELLEPSSVTVTAPNGSEPPYLAASSMTISWTDTGPVAEVLIEFSSDNGVNWTEVNTVDNAGSYLWDPIADVDSENCLIRVTNTNDVTAIDQSNATFVIYQIPDLITVTDPNGGEQFLAGSEMEIHWTSVGDVNDVKIMFSDNDGDVWQDVVLSTPNNGEFIWDANDVPADANSIQCIIHISDVADSSTWDVSDDPFIVFQCDTALTADLTGDCFVDIADFAEFAYQWLLCGNPYDEDWCFE